MVEMISQAKMVRGDGYRVPDRMACVLPAIAVSFWINGGQYALFTQTGLTGWRVEKSFRRIEPGVSRPAAAAVSIPSVQWNPDMPAQPQAAKLVAI